jgi:hypothetical protein
MGKPFVPLSGIRADVKARLACYKRDWTGGFNSGYRLGNCVSFSRLLCALFNHGRILAPTAYIFFASALPVIAFGEQLERDTSACIFYTPLASIFIVRAFSLQGMIL